MDDEALLEVDENETEVVNKTPQEGLHDFFLNDPPKLKLDRLMLGDQLHLQYRLKRLLEIL